MQVVSFRVSSGAVEVSGWVVFGSRGFRIWGFGVFGPGQVSSFSSQNRRVKGSRVGLRFGDVACRVQGAGLMRKMWVK